jgi:hypothetical protein
MAHTRIISVAQRRQQDQIVLAALAHAVGIGKAGDAT